MENTSPHLLPPPPHYITFLQTGEVIRGKRGRPRKHAPKIPLPPLYVFIRNLLHSTAYNPSTVAWVDEAQGCFKVGIHNSPICIYWMGVAHTS